MLTFLLPYQIRSAAIHVALGSVCVMLFSFGFDSGLIVV